MFLYESVSCVCLSMYDEPVLFCIIHSIFVCENVELFICLDGPREDSVTYRDTICK